MPRVACSPRSTSTLGLIAGINAAPAAAANGNVLLAEIVLVSLFATAVAEKEGEEGQFPDPVPTGYVYPLVVVQKEFINVNLSGPMVLRLVNVRDNVGFFTSANVRVKCCRIFIIFLCAVIITDTSFTEWLTSGH